MILVKHIEYLEVEGDIYNIISQTAPYETVEVLTDKGREFVPINEIVKLIKGRRFTRPDGKEICIGMSQQASDVIGLQYEAYENLKRSNEDYYLEIVSANAALDKLKTASLLTRFKWLFTGVK